MKHRSLLTMIAAVSILVAVFAACKKNNNNTDTSDINISVTIGGTVFKPQLDNALYGGLSHTFIFTGSTFSNGDSTLISLAINPPLSLNTDLAVAGQAAVAYQDKGKKYAAGGGSGPLHCTITALDSVHHTIAGTFSGTLFASSNKDTLSMANGVFNATYSVVNNF